VAAQCISSTRKHRGSRISTYVCTYCAAGESLRSYRACVNVRIRTYAVCGLVELQEPHVRTYLQRTLCMTRHLVSLVATRSMYVRRLSLVGTNSLYECTPLCVLGQYTGIYCNCKPTYASLRIVGLSIILQQRTRYMMSLVCLWLSWD
jgi:hypothetical protein